MLEFALGGEECGSGVRGGSADSTLDGKGLVDADDEFGLEMSAAEKALCDPITGVGLIARHFAGKFGVARSPNLNAGARLAFDVNEVIKSDGAVAGAQLMEAVGARRSEHEADVDLPVAAD